MKFNHTLSIIVLIIILFTYSCKEVSQENENTANKNSVLVLRNNTGIEFNNELIDTDSQNIIEYLYYYNGGGVGVGDINGDGLEDVYLCSNQKEDKLYLNKGNLQFEDVTKTSGILSKKGWSTGVAIDDVNGDGFVDIYVCRVSRYSDGGKGRNLLYINDGKGKFTEQASKYGLDFKGYSTNAAFLDYDHDGDLDMYLLNHAVHSIRSYGNIQKRKEKDAISGDLFFENKVKEEGKFIDVTHEAGIYNSPMGYGLTVSCADVNGDGWTDIYVGNDFHENDYLYVNNGNKSFTESISKACGHTTQFSMGVDINDMNHDGLPDIFSTDMMPYDADVALVSGGEDSDQIKQIKKDLGFESQHARNHFQINQGDGSFADVAYMTGTFATDWSWSVLLQDFDNNGSNDIFITNGIVKRPNNLDYINFLNEYDNKKASDKSRTKALIDKMPTQSLPNILFLNNGEMSFTDLHSSFIGSASYSTGAAYADLDQDGDLDIITNNINEKAFVYENLSNGKGKSLCILLKSDPKNTHKGTKVFAYSQGKVHYRECQTTKGFLSCSSPNIHIGLGKNEKVDSLIVLWPDNTYQKIDKFDNTKWIHVDKNNTQGIRSIFAKKDIVGKSFVLPYQHQENLFYDENNEKLVPERLSSDGPALIVEDLNGDGFTDLYFGGARNQEAKLYLGNSNGSYTLKPTPSFESDAQYEDIDAATIDFDGDGDKDIYVVSGGNDKLELDKANEDRIYLNNGNGIFKRIPISLPHTNGSCVAISDFDNDGYQDIFVGARSIPGSYGLSPYSFILHNEKGRGVDIASKVRFGMITDAKWADLDGDKDSDLVLCGDYMPITIYENNMGKFEEKTKQYGLDSIFGFWNAIEVVDVNGDGKLDILGGNIGLNTKLTASKNKPILLSVGDFDQNGISDPLLFFPYFGRYIPFASRDKLSSHMPSIKKTFNTYDSFKKVRQLSDLGSKLSEAAVENKRVNELRSIVFLWNNGKYEAYPMDKNEQMSDINDFEVTSDGSIIYVGNQSNYVAELGENISNSGRLLSNFDKNKKRFLRSQKLAIPTYVNARKIKGAKDKYIIASNNGYVYIFEK